MFRKNALRGGAFEKTETSYEDASIEEQRSLFEELETSLREAREDFEKSKRNLKACEAARDWFVEEYDLEEE